eukprot:maker-scaffold335_size202896-snap-gene-1.19 protein:Tk05622 transcript:maker-scaffold335_size202896-snap-gene-1.19-mRNA-1 annotation:"hypothetical protein DAPPUDRAFT_240263"
MDILLHKISTTTITRVQGELNIQWDGLVISGQGNEVLINLPKLGTLQGRMYKTVGNLANTPKDYYSFKNIPYAKSVANETRFTQPILKEEELGTPGDPYDARSSGPLCHQSNLDSGTLYRLTQMTMSEFVHSIVDIPDNPLFEGAILKIISAFLEFEIPPSMTFGELLDTWLDISLGVSEDCLHLSVNTPVHPDEIATLDKKLPVMFFIHGGAFYLGTQMKMDAARLGDVADVIVVAINYRVGPLGFMCLDTEDAAGNMGMLDMVTALKWVQNNIQDFGGDPDQVTIFGESAGSASIGHLLLSPLTNQQKLFSQGIGQSGSAISPWAFDRDPNFHAKNIAAKMDCDNEDHSQIVACLRTKSAQEIMSKHREYVSEERARGSLGFGGTIPCAQTKGLDKFYIQGQNPHAILTSGNYTQVPILFGANKHEGSYVYGVVYNEFLIPNNFHNNTDYLANELILQLLTTVGIDQEYALADLLEVYYFQEWQLGSLEHMVPGMIDILSTFFLKASSYKMVQENSKNNQSYWYSIEHETQKKTIYNLLFIRKKPAFNERSGVCHADELMYLFNINLPLLLCNIEEVLNAMAARVEECDLSNIGACIDDITNPNGPFKAEWGECITGRLTAEEEVWSNRIVRMWTDFARTGNPTPDDSQTDVPKVPAWSWDKPLYVALRENGATIMSDYTETYNEVMRDTLTEAPVQSTTTMGPNGETGAH